MSTAADRRGKAEQFLERAAQCLSSTQRREYLELAAQWHELAAHIEAEAAPLMDSETAIPFPDDASNTAE